MDYRATVSVVAILVWPISPRPADAATVSLSFTGFVTQDSATTTGPSSLEGVFRGAEVTGSWTYETDNAQLTSQGTGNVYGFPTGQGSVVVNIGTNTWRGDQNFFAQTLNDFSLSTNTYDEFIIGGSSNGLNFPGDLGRNSIQFSVRDTSSNLLDSGNLPTSSSDFDFANSFADGRVVSIDPSTFLTSIVGFRINPQSFGFGSPMPAPQAITSTFGGTALFGDVEDFDSTKPTVVLTHGWQPGGVYTGQEGVAFLDESYDAINTQYNQDADPTNDVNILEFTWEKAFTESIRDVTQPLPYASDAGVSLGTALYQVLGEGYNQPLHLIGHSYGSVVNVTAASELSYLGGITTTHMTVLDAPTQYTVPTSMFTLAGESPWVDYLENYYGTGKPVSDGFPSADILAFGEIIPGSQLAGGYSSATGHEGVWRDYKDTIGQTQCSSSGGFVYSASLGGSGCFADRPGQVPSNYVRTALDAQLDPLFLQHSLFDIGNTTVQVTTGSDGFATFNLTVPDSADTFGLDFQFLQIGDGDWLEFQMGDHLLGAYQGSIMGTATRSVLFDITQFAGKTDIFSIVLASVGQEKAEIQASNFKFYTAGSVESTSSGSPSVVPLPASMWLLLSGLGIFFVAGRRKKASATTVSSASIAC